MPDFRYRVAASLFPPSHTHTIQEFESRADARRFCHMLKERENMIRKRRLHIEKQIQFYYRTVQQNSAIAQGKVEEWTQTQAAIATIISRELEGMELSVWELARCIPANRYAPISYYTERIKPLLDM